MATCHSPGILMRWQSCRWQSHAGRELPQQERRAATQEPAKRGRGRLGPSVMAGPLTTSLRVLWVSGLLPPDNGGPYERAATPEQTKRRKGTTRTLGWHPKEKGDLTATKRGTLEPARVLHQGRGPKDPSARRGRDPRTLASRRHWLVQVVAATASIRAGSAAWRVGGQRLRACRAPQLMSYMASGSRFSSEQSVCT